MHELAALELEKGGCHLDDEGEEAILVEDSAVLNLSAK